MASLLIATPCYGKVVGEGYLQSLLASIDLLRQNQHQVKVYTLGNESLITRARNNIVAYFLASSFDRLIFIDADITWPPQALLDLIKADHDVCGIPYPTKSRHWGQVISYVKKSIEKNEDLTQQKIINASLQFTINRIPGSQPKNGWLEVSALGTGFFMMKRNVLEKMRDHYRDTLAYKNDIEGYKKIAPEEHCVGLFETMIEPESKRYLSEDYAFCKRWIELDGKIFANVSYRLIHSGTADF
jgi:hypothetical protein